MLNSESVPVKMFMHLGYLTYFVHVVCPVSCSTNTIFMAGAPDAILMMNFHTMWDSQNPCCKNTMSCQMTSITDTPRQDGKGINDGDGGGVGGGNGGVGGGGGSGEI